MQPITNVAVIGGTGKAGTYLVQQLINQGFHLKLLHRPGTRVVEHPLVTPVMGDARDYSAIRSLVEGYQAIISTLGQPRGEAPIFRETTRHVLRAMQEGQVHRYVLITGLNVNTPTDRKGPFTQSATDWMKTNYSDTTADKQKEYALLANSEARWTLVRLPLIELTSERSKLLVNLEDCPGDRVSATSLAHFLVEQLNSDQYVGQAPFVANA
ncbi:MAG: NAD(P)H-binding protein [Tunicatimonas sp.]